MPLPARLFAIFLTALPLAFGAAYRGLATEISGRSVVLDGDTIDIGTNRIRLSGVDTPETDQVCIDGAGKKWSCGIAVRDALERFIAKRPVRCQESGTDAYDRKLATCMAGADDINRWLIREGLALAYVKYSREYVEEERRARELGRGMWAGAFIAPWDWRTRTRSTALLGSKAKDVPLSMLLAPAETPPDPACTIKGNVNRKGERIFHVPGQRDYDRINMKPVEKRWFCSEAEALAAGWRKAQR